MSISFRTEVEASAELEEVAVWYEQQRPGLGLEFLEAVDDALEFIGHWPHSGTPVPDVPPELPIRRAPVRRFPYQVVYVEIDDSIRILAFGARSAIAWILAQPRKAIKTHAASYL